MKSYSQPWTVINKYESEPKTYEFYPSGVECEKVEIYQIEKPEAYSNEKPEYYRKEQPYYKGEKPSYYREYEKPEYYRKEPAYSYYKNGKIEGYNYEKPTYYGEYEKPEVYGKPGYSYYKSEGYSHGKPEYQRKEPFYYNEEKPEHYGKKFEKITCELYNKLEDLNLKPEGRYYGRYENEIPKYYYKCAKNCCDKDLVEEIKTIINILIGAEQSYIQLGFLCMDERFTLVNTSEYFRLCGLRMRYLANGLITRSVRLFNVHEWINNTTFENYFKVPTKEELATNDYTSIIKTFFKITMEAEKRLVEHMKILGDKIIKNGSGNSDCHLEGFKWFVNFVVPYQIHFVKEVTSQLHNIEMCNNGFIFDKCEMYPLVQKIEEFIHRLVKVNTVNVIEKKMFVVPRNGY